MPGDRIDLPCFSTSFSGSTPGDRMKNNGVPGPDSSKVVAKSSDLPATYLLPSFSSTKSLPERKKCCQFVGKMQIPLQIIDYLWWNPRIVQVEKTPRVSKCDHCQAPLCSPLNRALKCPSTGLLSTSRGGARV